MIDVDYRPAPTQEERNALAADLARVSEIRPPTFAKGIHNLDTVLATLKDESRIVENYGMDKVRQTVTGIQTTIDGDSERALQLLIEGRRTIEKGRAAYHFLRNTMEATVEGIAWLEQMTAAAQTEPEILTRWPIERLKADAFSLLETAGLFLANDILAVFDNPQYLEAMQAFATEGERLFVEVQDSGLASEWFAKSEDEHKKISPELEERVNGVVHSDNGSYDLTARLSEIDGRLALI